MILKLILVIDVKFLVLLVLDIPQHPNLWVSHASTHTQQPSLSIITQQGPQHLTSVSLLNNTSQQQRQRQQQQQQRCLYEHFTLSRVKVCQHARTSCNNRLLHINRLIPWSSNLKVSSIVKLLNNGWLMISVSSENSRLEKWYFRKNQTSISATERQWD